MKRDNYPILKITDVNKKIIIEKKNSIEKTILNNINLTINKGDFVVIFGESGSGKSTLLSIMSALEKPTNGKVEICGEEIQKWSEKKLTKIRKEKIGFIFQQYGLLNDLTVRDNILLNTTNKNFISKIKEITDVLDITDKLNKKVKQLSGGQKQRVSIARAIIKKPLLLFADEPTGAVDYKTGNAIIETFKKLNRDDQITIIMVTHNRDFLKIGNKTIEVSDGEIIKQDCN